MGEVIVWKSISNRRFFPYLHGFIIIVETLESHFLEENLRLTLWPGTSIMNGYKVRTCDGSPDALTNLPLATWAVQNKRDISRVYFSC